jgi:hypothetical protein
MKHLECDSGRGRLARCLGRRSQKAAARPIPLKEEAQRAIINACTQQMLMSAEQRAALVSMASEEELPAPTLRLTPVTCVSAGHAHAPETMKLRIVRRACPLCTSRGFVTFRSFVEESRGHLMHG